MQEVSSAFTAATQATVRQPVCKVEIAWDGVTWSDETAYVQQHSGTLRLAAPGDELIPAGDVGTATVELSNEGRRYSWWNTGGPLAAWIGGPAKLYGKRVRIKQGYRDVLINGTPEWVTIFTGVIYDWNDDQAAGTLTLYLRDMGYAYVQCKRSSPMLSGLRADEVLAYYADLASILSVDRVLMVASERIPFAWLDDESVLEEMWQVAQAVGGRCYFDQLGCLRFETATAWAGRTTTVWHFTQQDYGNLRATYAIDNLASDVVVEWAPRYISLVDTVYTLTEAKLIRPGETLTFEARFTNPLYGYVELTADDYKIISVGGGDLGTAVVLTLPPVLRYAQRCTVQVVNNHPTLAALLIFLQIRGYPLVGGPTDQVSVQAAPNVLPLTRLRSLRGNAYVQTAVQADALSQLLLGRCQQLAVAWQLQTMGVPQLELGDRVAFDLPDITDPIAGYVTEISWRFAPEQGFTQDITMLDAAGLYPYQDYYVIGGTPLGVGRAWY